MKAMVIDRLGGPELLREASMSNPFPGPDEVLVRVAYAGVNPVDAKIRDGRARYFELRFPFVPGFDGAGVIEEVGNAVKGLARDDRVMMMSNQLFGEPGTYAELTVAQQGWTVKLPDHVPLAAAATLASPGLAAWEAVCEVGAVGAGMTVLVNGAAGGVGSIAVQLARSLGARVAATCGAKNSDYVQSLGAELAIDYHAEDVPAAVNTWAPGGVDIMIDAVGQGSLPEPVDLVRRGGKVAAIGALINDYSEHAVLRARAEQIAMIGAQTLPERMGRQLRSLMWSMADGRLRPPAIEVLDLLDAAEAHRRIDAQHVRGKLLLRVADIGI